MDADYIGLGRFQVIEDCRSDKSVVHVHCKIISSKYLWRSILLCRPSIEGDLAPKEPCGEDGCLGPEVRDWCFWEEAFHAALKIRMPSSDERNQMKTLVVRWTIARMAL